MSLSHELHELCEVIPALREEQFREKKPKMEMFYTGSTLYSKEAMAIYIHLHFRTHMANQVWIRTKIHAA